MKKVLVKEKVVFLGINRSYRVLVGVQDVQGFGESQVNRGLEKLGQEGCWNFILIIGFVLYRRVSWVMGNLGQRKQVRSEEGLV